MQVTKETWLMRKQRVPGSLFSSPAQQPRNKTSLHWLIFRLAITVIIHSNPSIDTMFSILNVHKF